METIPQWQKYLLRGLLPLLKFFVVKLLNVNFEGAEDGLKKAKNFLREMDQRLGDGRK